MVGMDPVGYVIIGIALLVAILRVAEVGNGLPKPDSGYERAARREISLYHGDVLSDANLVGCASRPAQERHSSVSTPRLARD